MGENVTGYRYIAHLYCLAVQAGFYSDVVECWLSTQENLVRSPSGQKEFFFACYIYFTLLYCVCVCDKLCIGYLWIMYASGTVRIFFVDSTLQFHTY